SGAVLGKDQVDQVGEEVHASTMRPRPHGRPEIRSLWITLPPPAVTEQAAAEPGAGRVTSAARRPSADALTGSAGVAGVLGRGRADPGAVGVAGRPLAADLVLAGGAGADEDRGARGGGDRLGLAQGADAQGCYGAAADRHQEREGLRVALGSAQDGEGVVVAPGEVDG